MTVVYLNAQRKDPQHDLFLSEPIDAFNSTLGPLGIPKVNFLTRTRALALNQLLHDFGGIDIWREAVGNVASSDFLLGKTSATWRLTFDWFIRPENYVRVLEGNYANRQTVPTAFNSRSGSSLVAAVKRINGVADL